MYVLKYLCIGSNLRLTNRSGIFRQANLATYAHHICRNYGKALTYGTRYIYQTLPRLLTLWLDLGHIVANCMDDPERW